MDARAYNSGLAKLRTYRDEIKSLEREEKQLQQELDKLAKKRSKLESERDQQISQLGEYEKAKADRIAPAAGLSIGEVADLIPTLSPQKADTAAPAGDTPTPEPVAGAPAPDLRHREGGTPPAPAGEDTVDRATPVTAPPDAVPTPDETGTPSPTVPVPAGEQADRELPSIPAGKTGDAWTVPAESLVSRRPRFTQQPWDTAFLDAQNGMLVHKHRSGEVDLGSRSAADILTAVGRALSESVERVYITGGAPWHRGEGRYPHLKDAVAAWLNAPTPGWTVASGKGRGKGKDHLAGHFAHERRPVGRWQRGDRHLELAPIDCRVWPQDIDDKRVPGEP